MVAVVSERDRQRDRPREPGNLGNQERGRHPLDKDQCTYCKEKGHWARECPRAQKKDLALAEEDED